MDRGAYQSSSFGSVTRRPGDKWAFDYYLPTTIPRTLQLDEATVLALSEADGALGLLNGSARLISDPDLLLGPFVTREALASSRIEGTNASLSEVLRAEEVGETPNDDVAEVECYLRALNHGLGLLDKLPLTQRLIKETHGHLMDGVRGQEKSPGAFRSTPVWIGAADATPETAKYVPPLPEHLPDLIADWERFVNEPSRLPVLIRCALMHYQFETIHPFLDGNGRIGRLLVALMLINENRLSRPFLYLSGYLEAHRPDYYAHLQGVRERGDVQSWLQFFLVAVRKQSEDAVHRTQRLVDLREKYYRDCRLDRSLVSSIIPLIFGNPYLTLRGVRRAAGVSVQGARNLVDRATIYGWVEPLGAYGRSGRHIWIAKDVFDVIEGPLDFGDAASAERR